MQDMCCGGAGTQKPFSRMYHKMRRGGSGPYTYSQGHECTQDSYGVHTFGSSERLSYMSKIRYLRPSEYGSPAWHQGDTRAGYCSHVNLPQGLLSFYHP